MRISKTLPWAFLSVCLASGPLLAQASTAGPVGRKIPAFVLPDQNGKLVGLGDYLTTDVIVLFTMGTECPISNLYMAELRRLQERYGDQGLQFLGINADAGVTQEAVATHVEDYSVAFPVLVDGDQRVVDMLGVDRTVEAFVLDGQRTVRYHGRVNDRFGYTYKNAVATRNDLEEAIIEVLANKPVSVATTPTLGCLITRNYEEEKREITYSRDVAPIIQNRCQYCHRPGEVAPFSLMNYADTRKWTDMIKEVVVQKRMPPWHADPRYGHFSSDRSLLPEELDTIVAWIDAGAPRGNPADLPTPAEYVEGWEIDQPDLIYRIPEEVTVPADGVIPYLHYTIPLNFEEDVWVTQVEARPDNRAVVHHITVEWEIPAERRSEAPAGGRGASRRNGGFARNRGYLVSFAPGELPFAYQEGVAARIPAGADMRVTMHYTPTGKVEKDRSLIGIVTYKGDGPPERIAHTGMAVQVRLAIPPHERNYRAEASFTFREDSLLMSLHPHMHLRGKNYQFTAVYPDGRRELLLSVPQWDFNWQNTYRLTEHKLMPAGTKLEGVAYYDNSTQNVANPNPDETVRWGDQTWEEMMVGWFNYSTEAPTTVGREKK